MTKIKLTIILSLLIPLLSMAQEYPVYILEGGYIVVQVELSDSVTGNFVLDTGAGANVLSEKMFKKVASEATKKGYFTGFRHDGDRLDGEVFEIPYLSLGEQKQVKPIVGVYPPLDAMGIDGLLSLKFFEDKPFSIDFKNQKIKFLSNDESKQLAAIHTTLPLLLYQHTNVMLDIFIPITVNDNVELLASFDTGSGYDTYLLNPGYITDLKIDESELSKQEYVTQLSRDERTDKVANLSTISVGEGSKKIENKDVHAIFREGLIYNALIGSGLFKDKIITIDIPNKTFIVQ